MLPKPAWEVEHTDELEVWWNDWYEEMVPLADDLYDQHLEQLREEGWIG